MPKKILLVEDSNTTRLAHRMVIARRTKIRTKSGFSVVASFRNRRIGSMPTFEETTSDG
jgi:hypothetical protein